MNIPWNERVTLPLLPISKLKCWGNERPKVKCMCVNLGFEGVAGEGTMMRFIQKA